MMEDKMIQDNEVLVHKIGQRISDCMKQTDYYIGYAPYMFQFVIEEYKGETVFSENISPIEQAIVGILSIDKEASIEKIGDILGFKVLQDNAEYNILSEAIKLLHRHNVISGDDSLYCLTNEGRVFASEGKRPEKESYGFKLWFNKNYPELTSLKDCLDADNIVEDDAEQSDTESADLEFIKNIAAKQAPKVHNPNDERVLVKAELLKSSHYCYRLYACFVKNVLTGDVRTIVYDESQDAILDDFSTLIDGNETLKASLFDSIVESVFIPEEAQLKEIENVEVTDGNEIEVEVSDASGIQKLHKKALYDEIAFENELKHIFTEDKPDEIWLISPWIGYFFVQCRVPMIEKVLKEGTKVFIAYSKKDPRDKNHSEMVNPQAQSEIVRLSETYPDFYCVELPKIFHTKNVLEVKHDQVIMFSGSFNILSFAIQESHKIIRGEQMAFVNPQKAKSEYRSYVDTFASVYVESARNMLSSTTVLSAQELNDNKLKYFALKSSMSSEVEDILDVIDSKLADVQRTEWSTRISNLQKMVTPLVARGIITSNDKKYFRKELSDLEETAKLLDLDEELVKTLNIIQEHVDKLKVRKKADKVLDKDGKSVSTVEEDYSESINKMLQKSARGTISPENLRSARNVLRNKKLSNIHQFVRYVVSLNLMQQAIKKKAENAMKYYELNTSIINMIEKADKKIDGLCIFVVGDVTYIDLCGIQVSFYRVPHTDKTTSIISSLDNISKENKRLNLHLYADELFNIVFNRE